MNPKIKISQLPAKGANLGGDDLIEVAEFTGTGYVSKSITGDELIAAIPPAAAAWGSITGTLSSQTDLQSALNAKQNTLTLTTTGTSGAATLVGSTLNIPQYSGGASGITIGTTAITSGTVGRILFEGTGNVVQESGNLFWDNTNGRLGIGTSSPSVDLHINKATATEAFRISQSGIANFYVSADGFATTRWLDAINYLSTNSIRTRNNSVGIDFANASGTSIGRFAPTTFNLLINTTTDAGFRLDVNGTARVSGQITATGGISLGSSVFPTTAANSISLTAHVAATDIVNLSYYTGAQSATSGIKNIIASSITFSPSAGAAQFNVLNFSPTINQTGGANGITRGLYINPTLTAAADFRAIETARGNVVFGNLPTSPAGLPTGAIYNNLGVLMIV